jgi:serine kinase of HPr protein (carbohydrate metabolism regulator)
MPVAPGRNLAALVEVAARIQLLRRRGYQASPGILQLPGKGPAPSE